MKVLLVQPRLYDNEIAIRNIILYAPLNLEILAANIPDHDVQYIDLRIEDELQDRLESFRPDVVGITSWTQDVYNARATLAEVKAFDPEIKTVVGGLHATLKPEEFYLDTVDAVVIGEGEITFPELLRVFASEETPSSVKGTSYRRGEEWVQTEPRELITDLDAFPPPDRSISERYRKHFSIVLRKDFGIVETGRGCCYRCKFCSVWRQHRGIHRRHSIDRMIELLDNVKPTFVGLLDDNFFQDTRHSENFCDAILASGIQKEYLTQIRTDVIVRRPKLVERWRKAGLSYIFLGLEGINDDYLARLNKGTTASINRQAIEVLRANDIKFVANILVDPAFSERDFQEIEAFVEETGIYGSFAITTPYPGTVLHEERTDDIVIHDYRLYDALHAVMRTRLPRVEFYKRFASLYKGVRMMHPFYDPGDIQEFLEGAESEVLMNFIQYSKNWKRYKSYLQDEERILGAGPAQ